MTRRRALIGGAALAVLLATFAAGRYSRSPKMVTVDKVKTETATQATSAAASTAHVEAIAHKTATGDVETRTVTVVKWLPAVPAKNGCPELPARTEQVTTTETHAVTARTADTQRASVVAKRQEQQASMQQTIVETHTSSPAGARWSFSLMPGYQWHGDPALDLKGPLVVQVSVEHRFIGPLSIGLWASTSGAAGITLRSEF